MHLRITSLILYSFLVMNIELYYNNIMFSQLFATTKLWLFFVNPHETIIILLNTYYKFYIKYWSDSKYDI